MSESNAEADVVRLFQAAQESLTDSMVERLSVTGANVLEVVDRLNDDDTRDAVMSLIDNITDMHRSGALDTLFQIVAVLHGTRNAMTDGMIERLFGFVENMVNNLANEDMACMADNARRALEQAVDQTAAQGTPSGGVMSTLSILGKPETQQALQFLVAFSSEMRARTTEAGD